MGLLEMLGEHVLQNPPTPVKVVTWIGRGAGTGVSFLSCLAMALLVTPRCAAFHSGFLIGLPVLAGLGWLLHAWAFRVFAFKLRADMSSAHEALLRYGNRSENERVRNYDDVRGALTSLGQAQALLGKAGLDRR